MKKLIFSVFTFSLALLFALSGCSCTATPPLTFNDAYLGEESVSGNYYSETLEYSVESESSYQTITNSAGVDQSKVPKYKGTYVVYFSNANNSLPDINTNINYDENDYQYIKSVLSLSFTVNGITYNDQIVSEVYFYSNEYSLAPVYSKTTMKYTYLVIGIEQKLSQVIYQYSTVYNKANFKTTKAYYAPSENEDINNIDVTNTNINNASDPSYFDTAKLKPFLNGTSTYEYTVRTAIDNNQLMFAIRNSNLGSVTLPTISYSYDKPIEIVAQNKNNANITIDELEYNGQTKENVNMPIKNVEFYINSTTNRGSSKYMSIQKEAVDGINNNALIVEYAEPLLSGLSTIGALVYKLNKVTINN